MKIVLKNILFVALDIKMKKVRCKICHNSSLADGSGMEKFDKSRQEWLELPANVCGECVNIQLKKLRDRLMAG